MLDVSCFNGDVTNIIQIEYKVDLVFCKLVVGPRLQGC